MRKRVPYDGATITCPIPDRLMGNVVTTAQQYPDLDVSIWVDIYGVGNNTPRITQALNQDTPAPNIRFRSLDDIAKYAADPLFEKPFNGFKDAKGGNHTTFWQQHDLARLYVIEHALNHRADNKPIFYSDMDMKLTGTETLPKAIDRIAEYGVAVGLPSPHTAVDCQFFGFDKAGLSFLSQAVIPLAEETTLEGKVGWNGFSAAFHSKATQYVQNLKAAPLLNVGAVQIPDSDGIKESYQAPLNAHAQSLRPQL